MTMEPSGRHRAARSAEIAAAVLVHIILGGIVIDVALGLSTRDLGIVAGIVIAILLLGVVAVYAHNRHIGLVPYSRAASLAILLLPVTYIAAVLVAFSLTPSQLISQEERNLLIVGFFGLFFVTFPLAVVRERRRLRRFLAEVESPRKPK